MKEQIVSIESERIRLSSSLTSNSFGKINHIHLLNECGWVATVPNGATDTSGIAFSEWQFDGTQTDKDDTVAFMGKPLGNGKTLYALFEGGSEADYRQTAVAVCFALSAAIEQNIAVGAVGAEGICLFTEEKHTRILFLPADIFERCANNTTDSYADFQGCYIRKGLAGKEALLFTRAVIAYRALCGALPYGERDLSVRQADIFDARFIPSYMLVNGLDADLASTIDCGLQVSAELKPLPGERRFVNEKDVQKRTNILRAAERFSPATFQQELQTQHTPELPEAEFAARRNAFLKKQDATVRRARFLRRNHSRIIVAAIAVALGVWAVASFHNENKTLATSKGLTSWETTQALYATVHKSDVPDLQELAKGKKVKNLRQTVSGFYVTNRSRYAMNQDEGTVSPAEWLFLRNKTQYWQYGLTQLAIDGIAADSSFAYPTRADKPKPLVAEDGVTLKRGATVQHTVEYYLVNNDGSARLSVNTVADWVTLTWKRGRWIVTDIAGKSKQQFVFTKDFYADYQAALDETDGDVLQSAAMLRKTYEWIPTDAELRAGEASLLSNLTNLQKMSD